MKHKLKKAQATIEAHGNKAIKDGVFGVPSYVLDGEVFWGQDRLDFVMEKLAR
jgi:2-hydroxychromene-2-carboxylate isomerase